MSISLTYDLLKGELHLNSCLSPHWQVSHINSDMKRSDYSWYSWVLFTVTVDDFSKSGTAVNCVTIVLEFILYTNPWSKIIIRIIVDIKNHRLCESRQNMRCRKELKCSITLWLYRYFERNRALSECTFACRRICSITRGCLFGLFCNSYKTIANCVPNIYSH